MLAPAKEVGIKMDLESIIALRKKLAADKEIEGLEQDVLQFMGEAASGDS